MLHYRPREWTQPAPLVGRLDPVNREAGHVGLMGTERGSEEEILSDVVPALIILPGISFLMIALMFNYNTSTHTATVCYICLSQFPVHR